jgi:hypothetical protein
VQNKEAFPEEVEIEVEEQSLLGFYGFAADAANPEE